MGYYASSSSSSSSAASSSPSSSSSSLFAADLEAGFSGCLAPSALYPPPPVAMSKKMMTVTENLYRRSTFLGARPAKLFFCDGFDDDEPRHFLDSCFLCKKPLSGNCDIFMYRGDTPFCSEECRQEQIEIDEERDNDSKLRLKASSRKEQTRNGKSKASGGAASSPPKSPNGYHVRAGTVVAV